eukprot:gb/GECG01004671.1/.p1 GENE.gb/GECG01004671.1/~~gb/GECG01004671.1/.p1  ORF type:complete len:421 (+),score=40.93 gb/GECG01004671.1/:1-1263(+)
MATCWAWSGTFLALSVVFIMVYFVQEPLFSAGASGDLALKSPAETSGKDSVPTAPPPRNPAPKLPVAVDELSAEGATRTLRKMLHESSETWVMHQPPVQGAMPKLILGNVSEQLYMLKLSCRFKHSMSDDYWLTKGYNAILATALDEVLLGRGDPRGHGKIIPVKKLASKTAKDERAWKSIKSRCLWKAGDEEFVAGVLLQYGKHIKDRKDPSCQIFRDHAEDSSKQWILDMLIGQADRYCNHNVFINTNSGRQVFLDFDDGSYFNQKACSASQYLTLTNPFFIKGSNVDKKETYCAVSEKAEHLARRFLSQSKLRMMLQKKLRADDWFRVFLPYHYFRSGWMDDTPHGACKAQSVECKISRSLGTFQRVSSACVSDFVRSYENSSVSEIIIAALSDIYSRRASNLYHKLESTRKGDCAS